MLIDYQNSGYLTPNFYEACEAAAHFPSEHDKCHATWR